MRAACTQRAYPPRMRHRPGAPSPLAVLAFGVVAGAIGSLVQNVFFAATKGVAPQSPKNAFSPPEPEQQGEMPTQTIARRFVEGMMQRRLTQKERGAQVVHIAFGAAWGGLYGLGFESSRRLRGALGAAAFSGLVWVASDNLILPAFKLAAPPNAYPPRTHAYAFAAHLAYGGAVWMSYRLLRPAPWQAVLALSGAAWVARKLPEVRGLAKTPRIAQRTARLVDSALGY
jgi:hypothetical protein